MVHLIPCLFSVQLSALKTLVVLAMGAACEKACADDPGEYNLLPESRRSYRPEQSRTNTNPFNTVDRVRKTAEITSKIVYGYCWDIQNSLKSDHKIIIIPTELIDICLAYVFIFEHFVGKYPLSNDDNNKLTTVARSINASHCEDHLWHTTRGAFIIDCNDELNENSVFSWTFDIHNIGSESDQLLSIGIEDKEALITAFAYDAKGDAQYHPRIWNRTSGGHSFVTTGGYNKGDRISMAFDVYHRSLNYYKHQRSDSKDGIETRQRIYKSVGIHKSDAKYCLAVNLHNPASITLVDFTKGVEEKVDSTLGGVISWSKIADFSALLPRDVKLKLWNGVFKTQHDHSLSEEKKIAKVLRTMVMLQLTRV